MFILTMYAETMLTASRRLVTKTHQDVILASPVTFPSEIL